MQIPLILDKMTQTCVKYL